MIATSRILVVIAALAGAASAAGVRGSLVAPPSFQSYTTVQEHHNEDIGIKTSETVRASWQVDNSEERVAYLRIKGVSVPYKQVYDYKAMKQYTVSDKNECEYYCPISSGSHACTSLQDSLCNTGAEKSSKFTANVTVPGSGEVGDEYMWSVRPLGLSISTSYLYLNDHTQTPMEFDTHLTPAGHAVGWANITYSGFQSGTPNATDFDVPGASTCKKGNSDQCGSTSDDFLNNDTF